MSTYTQILYHIVFSTKNRTPSLQPDSRERLFRYIWGIIKKKNCHLHRINGVEDHLHILTSLHPCERLADLVRDVKASTSLWIRNSDVLPDFVGWQDGYGAFTHSKAEMDALVEYIKDQQKHHERLSFREELEALLKKAGIEFDERFLV
ncbi:MAG: IS200/IS605 family transposase [Candidatus Coatesbacteria bacterium]|nr:IS200/IS605 family transposase [Candidatus Coatesbacteria bacterium]